MVSGPERLHGPLHDVAEDLRFELGLRARSEAREVEQVLDDGVEPVGIGRDVIDHRRADSLVEFRAAGLEQARVAIDGRDRGPQFVRHEPEEGVLDGVRGLERLCRGGDRPFGVVALGHVHQHVDRAHQAALVIEEWRRVGHKRDIRAVGPDGDRLATADRSGLLERDRHRTLVVTHRRFVGPQQAQRPAPLLAEGRPPSPELGCGLVEERDPAVRIGRVDGHPERVKKPAVAVDLLVGGPRRDRSNLRPTAGDDAEQVAIGRRRRQGRRPSERVGTSGLDGHAVLREGEWRPV